jgi:hypothetical protein
MEQQAIYAGYSKEIVFDKQDAKLFYHDKCDKYDYLTAVGCGVIGGLIDVFLVGSPKDSFLGKWTDKQVDNVVTVFAKICGWKPKTGNEENVKSAIGFLEKKFKINYDQANNNGKHGAGGAVDGMTSKNHHMKSLAHSPDIIGLFFSILNQFTSTSTFLSEGQLITINTDTYELYGKDFFSKLFCGVVNWFGHIISDMAGSSGAKGRGSGIVIPFFELFQIFNLGEFKIGKDRQDLATLATRVFQEGYDFRFGLAMAIPVILSEMLVRLIWAMRRRFEYKLPIKECIPLNKYDNLRIMLIVSHGTLCVIDVSDAGIRSGGDALNFFLHINIIAWYRFTSLVLKEIFIRLGIAADIQQYLESIKIVNNQIHDYTSELERIDINQFRVESERNLAWSEELSQINDDSVLCLLLEKQVKAYNLEIPWGEDDNFQNWLSQKGEPLMIGRKVQ